jgi:hypothetical protein
MRTSVARHRVVEYVAGPVLIADRHISHRSIDSALTGRRPASAGA